MNAPPVRAKSISGYVLGGVLGVAALFGGLSASVSGAVGVPATPTPPPPPPPVDFAITKSVDNSVVQAGGTVTFTLRVENLSSDAGAVSISDDLTDVVDQGSVVSVGSSMPSVSCSIVGVGSAVSCGGSIPAEGVVNITIVVDVDETPSPGQMVNDATVAGANDPNSGNDDSNTVVVTITEADPTVTSVDPNVGPEAGGTSVVVTGTGFDGSTRVQFDGVDSPSYSVNSSTELLAVSPPGTGTVDVTVDRLADPTSFRDTQAESAGPVILGLAPMGSGTAFVPAWTFVLTPTTADDFTYLPAPTVAQIDPTSGPEAGGTSVAITGTDFDPGATTVTFGGTPATSVNCSTTSCTAVAPPGAGTVDVAVTTAGGTSANTPADNYTYIPEDTTDPSASIVAATGQDDPTNTAPINFTVTFDESVTGFTDADLTLGGTAGGSRSAIVSGVGTTYNVAVSGMSGEGTVTAQVKAGAATDAADNPSTASGTASVDFDSVAPSASIVAAAGQDDPTNTAPINFTVTFDESVTGFTDADLTLGGTAGGSRSAIVSGVGTTYNVAVSGMSGEGTVTAQVKAGAITDAANNASTASTTASVTFDGTAPSASIVAAAGQDDPTNTAPIEFTVTFDEPVSGLTDADIDLAGSPAGSAATVTGASPGTTFTVSVSGMTADGVVSAKVAAGAANDLAGNPNTESLMAPVRFDGTSPSASIAPAAGQDDPTNTGPVEFTVTFDEPVSGLTDADIDLAGSPAGSTASVTGPSPGTIFTVSVSGMTADGDVSAKVPAGAAQDAAGNASTASSTATVAFDGTAPTVSVEKASGQADPTASGPILFDVTFTESVTGFEDADVVTSASTAGGTLAAAVSGTGDADPATYRVSVSGMSAGGTVTISVPTGAAKDAAGNDNAASSDASVLFDPDSDGDGLTDAKEASLGTNPNDSDSDNDGLTDGRELRLKATYACLNLLRRDSEADGLADGTEVNGFTIKATYTTNVNQPGTRYPIGKVRLNPCRKDTDRDGLTDRQEAVGTVLNQRIVRFKKDGGVYTIGLRKSHPLKRDTDGDGLSDRLEITGNANWRFDRRKSDPTVADTDWGGGKDGREVLFHRTDPTWAGR